MHDLWWHTHEVPSRPQARTVLCVGTQGPSDLARATLPFAAALRALEQGNESQIALMGEAALLLKDAVAARVCAPSWPPLAELLKEVVAEGIPVFV
jgi:predicted peroxiredoxin